MKKLGDTLTAFLEIEENESNNDVAKERYGEKQIDVGKKDITSILQQLITIVGEGLTIPFNAENISNLESVGNTISGLSQDLQDKITKIKEGQHE